MMSNKDTSGKEDAFFSREMIRKRLFFINSIITSLFIALLVGITFWWMKLTPSSEFPLFVPGMDRTGGEVEVKKEQVVFGELFSSFSVSPGQTSGSWPRFRGENFDNINRENIELIDSSQEADPLILWQKELGQGYAGAAVNNGRVYLLDYDENRKADLLRCFSLDTGEEIWQQGYRINLKRNHGFSRTVPAVTDEFVLTMGPGCQVMCVDAASGRLLWGMDLVEKYGTAVPQWYTGQCPLIDDGVAILAPGGGALMIGVDCRTGEVLWETPNPMGWQMSHASIMPMVIDGIKCYVYPALGGLTGVRADGQEAGSILWQTKEWDNWVVASSPVIFDDGRIFLTTGYGAGSMMLRVFSSPEGYKTRVLYEHKPDKGLACEQQTPILYQGKLLGIMPDDGGIYRNRLVCYDPEGSFIWDSGKSVRFGLGPFMIADDKLYVFNDQGTLHIIEANVTEYKPLGTVKIMEGKDAWAPIALVGGKMLLRDEKTLVCLDIRKKR